MNRRSAAEEPVTAYVRDRGPICYEVSAFNDPTFLRDLPQRLMNSECSWYWKSARNEEPDPAWVARALPVQRGLTRLAPTTVAGLADDLWENDLDGNRRLLLLAAIHPGAPRLEDGEPFRQALRAFVTGVANPLCAVVQVLNDSPAGYVFVPSPPDALVLRLLPSVGVDLARVKTRRPYEHLRLAKLEDSYYLRS